MGNKKSKPKVDKLFDRERWKEHQRQHNKIKSAPRVGVIEAAVKPDVIPPPPLAPASPPPANIRSYDDDALDCMRHQLHYDSDAFLLNNILLSVQFFDNYEREQANLSKNTTVDREHEINEAMVQHHKHVFFADRLQEIVHENVYYRPQRSGGEGGGRGQREPLVPSRLFVIYDNVEASEPGDTSDYSAVLDAPFYKLCIQDSKEPGYIKLKKLEVLESTLTKETEKNIPKPIDSDDDAIYTDSDKESIASDDLPTALKGEELLEIIKNRMNGNTLENLKSSNNVKLNTKKLDISARRSSGPTKQISLQAQKANVKNVKTLRKLNSTIAENIDNIYPNSKLDKKHVYDETEKPRKSILKNSNTRRLSGPTKETQTKLSHVDSIAEDTETSGYRSTSSSSRLNELSETESDYGYATITESSTPKRIELSQTNSSTISGALPDSSWISIYTRADNWSQEEEEEDNIDMNSKISEPHLYEKNYYLSSVGFMRNFVDIFITDLGTSLGLSPDAIRTASTQGASIYCNTVLNGKNTGYEIYPALIAAWPNAANQWVIRERKIITNPRTNKYYQWPRKEMVHKAVDYGCFLVPVGYRPKRGLNPNQQIEWKLIFPAVERYLEKFLAHSHIRCYLFTLTLYKSFLEVQTSKVGIDASHIKNHLFWQCEDNYAKWPEDRPGESLRLFLESFYMHMCQKRLPNYFMSNCNDFKSIPRPLLMKLQRSFKDILETPVPHVLYALDKLKYIRKEFYPKFNCYKLYEILTCKNPLRIINPAIVPSVSSINNEDLDSEEEMEINQREQAKANDKFYRWRKEKHRRLEEQRRAVYNIKSKNQVTKQDKEINPKAVLPAKMEPERRRLVLEFFIPHFIAMSRSSEKFEAIGQAIIYLEQAKRLCMLLSDEPSGDVTANAYMEVINDKLADCTRKLANQGGLKLTLRRESNADRPLKKVIRKRRPKFDNINGNNSPSDAVGFAPFNFAEVHEEPKPSSYVKLTDTAIEEESKL